MIGLGSKTDPDAPLLEDIARRGNGRCFFTNKPEELPQLFAQDTFVVARSTFVDQPVPVQTTGAITALTGRSFKPDRPIGGYNLTYLRDRAEMSAYVVDNESDYRAPVVASWHVGAGRALVYTGEVDGEFTGPIAGWPDLAPFVGSLVRWTMGKQRDLPGGALITQDLEAGEAVVRLHLDPQRRREPFDALPRVRVVRGTPGRPPQTRDEIMQWTGPDELTMRTPLYGDETVIHSVDVGEATMSLAPVTLPYSSEFNPVDAESGPATLEQLSEATGGVRRDILGEIWNDLPRQSRLVNLAPWLLLAATGLFLLEVFERRSGMLSSARRPRRAKAVEETEPRAARPTKRPKAPKPPGTEPAPDEAPTPPPLPETPPPPSEGGMSDALDAARRRAGGRTGRR